MSLSKMKVKVSVIVTILIRVLHGWVVVDGGQQLKIQKAQKETKINFQDSHHRFEDGIIFNLSAQSDVSFTSHLHEHVFQ